MTDPWTVQTTDKQSNTPTTQPAEATTTAQAAEALLEFEDNFITATNNAHNSATHSAEQHHNSNNDHQPLPDSDNYLRGLERKLQKIKKGSKLVDALAEKREDCLRTLLQSGLNSDCVQNNNDVGLQLDEPINNGELYRHLQPVQPISVGELVHIVKHDQLEQQQQQAEQENTDEHRPGESDE